MDRKTNIIVTAGSILLLFVILIIASKNDPQIKELEFKELTSILENNNNSVVYFGQMTDVVLKRLSAYKEEYAVNVYTSNTKKEVFNDAYKQQEFSIDDNSYVLFLKNTPISIVGDDKTDKDLFYKYLYNVIPENEKVFKTIKSSDEYIKMFKSKKYTVSVIGRKSCTYCTLYLNTINDVAKDKNLNIYYLDSDEFDAEEYLSVLENLDFTIPAECTLEGEETTLMQGFEKPLTMITKNGELKGCLLGYVTNDILIKKLKEVGVLNE